MTDLPSTMKRIVSTATKDGTIDVAIEKTAVPSPKPGEVLIKVEAAPINPSDLALLLGVSDPSRATLADDGQSVSLPVPEAGRRLLEGRMGQAMPVGNEGAGTVVAAGDAVGEAMIGRRVAAAGGEMYAEYRAVPLAMCMPLPEDASAKDGASSFVNPMTALSMVEVMKRDGSPALVHTAGASNLGQMLAKVCKADGIPLIAIVRKPEQQALLKDLGVEHALNQKEQGFMKDLVGACMKTGATVAFDAVGGGPLAGQILTAMEAAQASRLTEYSRYGSSVHKQVYVYGRLDLSSTDVPPSVGMAWGVGGFLLPNFLATIPNEDRMRMAGRVMSELTTTFASHYTGEVSFEEMLKPDVIARYNAKETGTKYLLVP
jgi:NADPH:quinone reductase-like Zn-dependent oxidoreductase